MSNTAWRQELEGHMRWGTRQGSQRGYVVVECLGCKGDLSGDVTDDEAVRIGPHVSRAHWQVLQELWERDHGQVADAT